MSKTQDIGQLLLRLSFASFMVVGHGWGKFQRLVSGEEIRFADPLGLGTELSFTLATSAEFFCAILVGVGILTRLNLIPLAFTMAVAAFIVHGDDEFARKEKALMYFAAWVALFFSGPGRLTLQNLLFRRFNPENRVVRFFTR